MIKNEMDFGISAGSALPVKETRQKRKVSWGGTSEYWE